MNEVQPSRRHPLSSSRSLMRAIMDSDAPEQFVKSLSAQNIYYVTRESGLSSAAELLELIAPEQLQLLMDFDCWKRDEIDEEHLWEWLAVTDATDSLALLQKILKVFDLKLVAWLIERYVTAEVLEHATENPPGPNYSTPDQGRTWILVTLEDADRHFLMNRLLALIFESNADLFYQLLAIPGVSTSSELLEESYQDRARRLAAEGIPSEAAAHEVHALLPDNVFLGSLAQASPAALLETLPIVTPLVLGGDRLDPLHSIIERFGGFDTFGTEYTLLMNSAVVRFAIDFSDVTRVREIAACVRGAINIGLERGMRISGRDAETLYQTCGLQPLYRLGYSQILNLKRLGSELQKELLAEREPELQILVQGATLPFPMRPAWFGTSESSESREDGSLPAEFAPFCFQRDVDAVAEALQGSAKK
jgi:hypothetical protein